MVFNGILYHWNNEADDSPLKILVLVKGFAHILDPKMGDLHDMNRAWDSVHANTSKQDRRALNHHFFVGS